MSCSVEGCETSATEAVLLAPLTGKSVEEYGPWSATVCAFHAQALRAGEAFTQMDDGKIRLGTQVPPRLLNYTLTESGLNLPELTLHLGHDGIVSNDVTIQISEELHEHLFMNDEAELAREVERNKSDRD
jgi:hypothetical protein